jgi:hypothetical protein
MKQVAIDHAAAPRLLLPRWITCFVQFIGDLTLNAVMDDAWPEPERPTPQPKTMHPGDIANGDGDIFFSDIGGPSTLIMEGLVSVSFGQALAAIKYGWHWIALDGDTVSIMRGGCKLKCRKHGKELS